MQNHVYVGALDDLERVVGHLVLNDEAVLRAAARFKALRYRTFTVGRALLKHALVEGGYLADGEALPEMVYGSLGKPSFKAPQFAAISFNLTHSKSYMALCLGFSDGSDSGSSSSREIGIDLELVQPKRMRPELLERVVSPNDLTYLKSLATVEEQARFFTQQWTLRECITKIVGSSVFEVMADKCTLDVHSHTISNKKGFVGSLCCFSLEPLLGQFGCSDGFVSSLPVGAEAGSDPIVSVAVSGVISEAVRGNNAGKMLEGQRSNVSAKPVLPTIPAAVLTCCGSLKEIKFHILGAGAVAFSLCSGEDAFAQSGLGVYQGVAC